jgi:hypothetical protein
MWWMWVVGKDEKPLVYNTLPPKVSKIFEILSESHQTHQNFCTVCTFTNFTHKASRFTVLELKIRVTLALCQMAVGWLEYAVSIKLSLLGPPNKGYLYLLKATYIFVLIY